MTQDQIDTYKRLMKQIDALLWYKEKTEQTMRDTQNDPEMQTSGGAVIIFIMQRIDKINILISEI
jgi:hypothetical protein